MIEKSVTELCLQVLKRVIALAGMFAQPADQQRQQQAEQVQQQQQQQHLCQCHYCYQQQISTTNIVKPAVPFFLHPTTVGALSSKQQQPLHLQHGPGVAVCLSGPSAMLGVLQTPAGYGSSQQPLLLPQLYQLHCPAPTVMQSQYCAGDNSAVGEQTLTYASHVASSNNNWQGAYESNKCSNGSSFSSPVVNSSAAWTNVSMMSPIQPGGTATTAVTTSPGASVWRMRSPNGIVQCPSVSNVFSESSSPFMRPACATVSQSGMYVVGQQPGTLISMMGLQFAGVSGGNSDIPRAIVSSVNSNIDQQSAVNGFGSLPLTTSSPGIAIPSVCTTKCLSTSTVTSAGSLASHSVGAQITSHACQRNAAQGTLTSSSVVASHAQYSTGSCHQHINSLDEDNEFEEDDDEESGSDESSGTSNQKDGKYCECWHCEFFGHSAVSMKTNNIASSSFKKYILFGCFIKTGDPRM
jgi:hypothetical protein